MAGAGGGGPSGSNYDVFISFRGPDTRHSFFDFLYEYMTLCGIRVFVYNERLHVEEEIKGELMLAIRDSKICMPIFSKGYASSKWCLLELEEIMNCRVGHEVMPVFFDVTPADVKLKTSLYSDSLEELKRVHGIRTVDRWRKCLKDACKIKGWISEESTGQGKLISKITQEVLFKTRKRNITPSNPIVGIEGQVKAIKDLLYDRINHVRFVIIHGMGGIGKTTLAKVIFNEVSSEFQGCSFLSNIRKSSYGSGIIKLQQQIMDDIFRMSVSVHNVDYGAYEIRERSRNKKILLVLDDVDDKGQIQKLAGMFDWFGRGSRIIVTTRDMDVIPIELKMHIKDKMRNIDGEEELRDICFYKMLTVDLQHATTLFKRHSFIGDDENSFDDDVLLPKIVSLADGLPLALTVVGSLLFGQTKEVWRETLAMLERAPHRNVRNALMISYESLEENEKQIFLDIACYFRGFIKRIPMFVWESSNLFPVSGMNTLLHKSLIEIHDDGGEDRIWMHDQLRDLGREIIRRDGKHTRIWLQEEALRMVVDGKGTSDVALLNIGELLESYKFKKAGFEKLVNLRALQLSQGSFIGDFSGCFKQLRWFIWSSFPSNFKVQNFSLPNLIILGLGKTDIDENWTGWKILVGSKLKILHLTGCSRLTRTPNFSACLGLEMLLLHHCNRLTEIDNSIGMLHQLTHMEVHGSPNLKGLPASMVALDKMEKLIVTGMVNPKIPKFVQPLGFDNFKSLCHLKMEYLMVELMPEGIGQLKLLRYLSFSGCIYMTNLPESVWELESLVELNLSHTGIKVLSGPIGNMKELKVLDLSYIKIKMLPKSIGNLSNLEKLDVSKSTYMKHIPSEIGNLFSLRVLNLESTSIVELPSTIGRLSRLQHLSMGSCWKLKRVKQLPVSLSHLELPYFSLEVIPDLPNLVNLVNLSLFSNEAALYFEEFLETDDEEVNADEFPETDEGEVNADEFPETDDVEVNADEFPETDDKEVNNRHTRTISLDFSWIARLHQLRRLRMAVPIDISNPLQFDFRSFPWAELVISCSDTQYLSQLPPNLSELILTKFREETLLFLSYPNLKNLSVLFIDKLLTEEIDLRGLELLVNLHTIELWDCQSLMRLFISSCPPKLDYLGILNCPKLVNIWGLDRMESLHKLCLYKCSNLRRLPDLSSLVNIKDLTICSCDSMESMPALPRTEHPFNLHITYSGMLPNFDGPYDLYRGVEITPEHCGFRCCCMM